MAERTYLGGMTNTVLHRESDGVVIVEEKQDCGPILDQNARKRNHRFAGGAGDFQESFDIPMVEVLRWQKECGAPMFSSEHMAYMDAKLKSAEFAKLATAPTLRDPRIIIKGAR